MKGQRETADDRRASRNGALFILAMSIWGLVHFDHVAIKHSEIFFVPAILWLGVLFSGAHVLGYLFGGFAQRCETLIASRPTGLHGSASWVTDLTTINHALSPRQEGPYWGIHIPTRLPIFSSYKGSALTLGIPGSAKTVGSVVPNIMSIRTSKICLDLKGELSAMLADTLRARGETVYILNLGGRLIDTIGQGETYSPLDVIVDAFFKAGGLSDVSADVKGISLQILPEDEGPGSGNDRFFHHGSLDLIGWCILQTILVMGRKATMSEVNRLATNMSEILNNALWAAGELKQFAEGDPLEQFSEMNIAASPWCEHHDPAELDQFIRWYRDASAALVEILRAPDNRTFMSFWTGAKQALEPYNITTRTNKVLQTSSFRFSECKADAKKPVTIFITADPTRLEAQAGPAALVQWAALQELKRHPNLEAPVFVLADEITNFKLHDLTAALTWCRGQNIRFHLIAQSLAAYKKTYGEDGLRTMWGMTEIKQILPGTTESETLRLLEELLVNQSLMTIGHRGDHGQGRHALADQYSFDEKPRPLLTKDEIARCKFTLLFLHQEQPILCDVAPYAAIHPYRNQVGGNPYHGGKPFKLPIRLRLKPGRKIMVKK